MTSWIGVLFITTQALLVYAEQLHDITICGVELKDVLFNRTPNRRYFGEGCDYYFGKDFFPAIYPYEKINDSFQVQSSEGCWLSAARFGGGSEEDDITSKEAQCAERRKYEWRLFYQTDFTAGIVSDQLWVADPRFPLTVIPGTGGLFLFGNETYGRKGLFELDVNEYGAYQCCMRITEEDKLRILKKCRTSDRLEYLETLDFCKDETKKEDIMRTTSLTTPSTSSNTTISAAVKPVCNQLKDAHNSLCSPVSFCYKPTHDSDKIACQKGDSLITFKGPTNSTILHTSFVTCQEDSKWNLIVDVSSVLCSRNVSKLENVPAENDGACKQLSKLDLDDGKYSDIRYFYNKRTKTYNATCLSGVLITETGQNAPVDVVCDGDNKWVNLNTKATVSEATCVSNADIACAACGHHGDAHISTNAGACYAMCVHPEPIEFSLAGDGDETIYNMALIRCGSSHMWEVPIDGGKMVELKNCTSPS